MVLITHQVPDFTAPAVLGNGEIIENFNLVKFIKNKMAVIFFWPMDFTFVCPSELIAFDKRFSEFKNRNTEIIGISVDSVFAHNIWRKTPIKKGGIGPIKYPMVSDIKHEIVKLYNIEHSKLKVALRGSFIVDEKGIIRHQAVNDLPLGRNIDEIIRLIESIKFYEKNGEVCPAQWNPGKTGIVPTQKGIIDYLSNYEKDLEV